MKESLITLKIKYSTDELNQSVIFGMIKNYNNILRFTYNRVKDGIISTKDLTEKQSHLNNIFLDSHFKNSAIFDAKTLSVDRVIFGGKKLFVDRCQDRITKEEFQIRKLRPICSVGEALKSGNRKFQIINSSEILFKPCKEIHINLSLNVSHNYKKKLDQLIKLQKAKQIAITYKLDLDHVYLTFDNSKLESNFYKTKKDRIIAIDLNPNYIGYSIVDWKGDLNYKIVDSGVYSIKALNDYENSSHVSSGSDLSKYCTNKRNYEVSKIAHQLATICKHYRCECFGIEDLSIESKDLDKGRKLNRLINKQWNRNRLFDTLGKLIKSSSTKFVPVQPQYSSKLGNLVYRKEQLPDMILSSIEVGRRAYEFNNQYLLNIKDREKCIIFPKLELVKELIIQSLEELNIQSQFGTYRELFSDLKKSKQKYRFLLEEVPSERVFSKFYKKSYIKLYTFI